MTLRNIALVTFHRSAPREGLIVQSFVNSDDEFMVKDAGFDDYPLLPTVWWVDANRQVKRITDMRAEASLCEHLERANALMFGGFTWFSPHAYSVLARLLHWEALNYLSMAERVQDIKRPGVVDIIDTFFTPDNQRSTLTREDRESLNWSDMTRALPGLHAGLSSAGDVAQAQATFLLRMCYAASRMPIDF
jgi:hypothetical protein